jgi:pantoate--beta-alanine ligase
MLVIGDLSQPGLTLARPLSFVPTMGALHRGHAALISKARELSDSVLVSDFVNPLQFNDQSDLAKYPHTPEADIEIAASAGASGIWFPRPEEIYPADPAVVHNILPGPLGEMFEGASRPGHFAGVLTVVNRLFSLVQPTWAIFGEKDFQQLFLIREMVAERGLPISVIGVPTVRDSDGLALSSRNVRLSDQDREIALVIPRALERASQGSNVKERASLLRQTLQEQPGFSIDYAEIIDEETFKPATNSTLRMRALVAGWVNGVRLLDNMSMTGTFA